jgi:hypothetical protein
VAAGWADPDMVRERQDPDLAWAAEEWVEAAAQARVALAGACGSRVECRAAEQAVAGEPALVVQVGDQEVEEEDLGVVEARAVTEQVAEPAVAVSEEAVGVVEPAAVRVAVAEEVAVVVV